MLYALVSYSYDAGLADALSELCNIYEMIRMGKVEQLGNEL